MYCSKCGTENTNNASFCIECNNELQAAQSPSAAPQPPPGHMAPPPQMAGQPMMGSVPNYLVQSILLTIFCCLPLGIVAIVFAAQVNSKLALGDFYGAQEASNKAKMWCWWAFGLGLAGVVFYLAFMMLAVLTGMGGSNY